MELTCRIYVPNRHCLGLLGRENIEHSIGVRGEH